MPSTRPCHNVLLGVMMLAAFFLCLPGGLAADDAFDEPYSARHRLLTRPQTVVLPYVDVAAVLAKDTARREQGEILPARYGAPIDVDFDLETAGTWEKLEGGARLWRLSLFSPGARSLNLVYDSFSIPPGGRLFLYNEDRSMVIGPLTVADNPKEGPYATPLVRGDTTVLEYYEPGYARGTGEIRISRVVHGVADLFSENGFATKDFGDADFCHINVNCSEGNGHRNQQRSVVMIANSAGRLCSGALINNVAQDHTPYVLTANHCLGNPATWLFYFNYESPNCSNIDGTLSNFVNTASIVANNAHSDFALLELGTVVPKSYNAYYSGWSASSSTPSSTAGIHHPDGDIKKIALDDDSASLTGFNGSFAFPGSTHWEVSWDDGITAPGSSGSPLFDQNKRIVGQLHGGTSYCSDPQDPDYYGRFSESWDHGSSSSTRLEDHLDPNNTGTTVLNGKNDTRPNAPTNVNVGGCNGCLPRVTWTKSSSSGIASQQLWRMTFPEGWRLFKTLSSSITSWVDSEATIDYNSPEDSYCYKVRAIDNQGRQSDFSNTDCVTVSESPPWSW